MNFILQVKLDEREMRMSDRMKVSLLLPSRGVGGGVRAIMRFAKSLKSRGHDVRIFAKYVKPPLKDRTKQYIIDTLYGQTDWLSQSDVPVIDYTSLRDHSFDSEELVVAMCTQTTVDMQVLSKSEGIQVYHCHGMEIENWEPMIKAWHFPTYKIAVSSKLCRAITKETGQKCYGVVPDGVDLSEYYPSESILPRDGIGSIFRWRYSKDPGNVIRIFNILESKLTHTSLLSFGMGKKPRGLGRVKYFRLPTVEKGRELYSRCKVWFLPSIEEGFGLPILEAMACGCVVVATDSGGPSDIIINGENGFLVDVGNYGEIVRRITQILEDDLLFNRLVKKGFETVNKYSWESAGIIMEEKLMSIRKENNLIK